MIAALSSTPTTAVAKESNWRKIRAPVCCSTGRRFGGKYESKVQWKRCPTKNRTNTFTRDRWEAKLAPGLRNRVRYLKAAQNLKSGSKYSVGSSVTTFRGQHIGAVIDSS